MSLMRTMKDGPLSLDGGLKTKASPTNFTPLKKEAMQKEEPSIP